MSLTIDGGGETFCFELSDKNGNNHFFEIYSITIQSAIMIAQKWFTELYGHKATHLERNITGYPIIRNI